MTSNTEPDAPDSGTNWQTALLVVLAVAGVVTLIAIILTLSGANRARDQALKRQSHSYDVMILARTLDGTIARSEASLGRYVISGDRQIGRIYYDEWTLAGAQIDRLDQLVAENSNQQQGVDRLRAAYLQRGIELASTASNTNYKRNAQAFAHYYAAGKAASLPEISTSLDQIIAYERALLQDRTDQAAQSVKRSSYIAGLLAIFGMLIVVGTVVLGWFTVRTIGEKVIARADANAERERVEELSAAVAAATEELKLQEAKIRQIQKMDAVGQLTGGIAHDFNNMLSVVLGGLELARRADPSDRATIERHLESASEGADRAAALTRRLLAFSREEPLKPELIELDQLVSSMTDLIDRTLGDAIDVILALNGGGWRVYADRVQIENAVLNLAVNARDAMDGRGTLKITTGQRLMKTDEIGHCRPGDYVTLSVSDSGCGMTQEVIERAFEPFFTTKEVGKGTGLGLSQVFGLVSQLGGKIDISSVLEEGTTVTLIVPRDNSLASTVTAPNVGVPITKTVASLDILVVEDDPRVITATIDALTALGHRAIPCPDPLLAEIMLDAHPATNLVISDVIMPRRTGPEMVDALKQRHDHLKILFVTGFAGDANAGEFGDHQLLRKPFTLAALERAIEVAMTSPSLAGSASYPFSDLGLRAAE